MFKKIIDVSVIFEEDMPIYPGDTPVTFSTVTKMSDGEGCNMSDMSFGLHTGTHIDPPLHFIDKGDSIDKIYLDRLIGQGRVIDCTGIPYITANDLNGSVINRGELVLLKTDNSKLWHHKTFHKDFVHLELSGAQYLADCGIKAVGIDYISIEKFGVPDFIVHKALFNAGIIVIEGLNLEHVEPGEYTVLCMPLKIKDGDGAPARVALCR